MRQQVGSAIGIAIGAILAWVSVYGLVQSQTGSDGPSPTSVTDSVVDYGNS